MTRFRNHSNPLSFNQKWEKIKLSEIFSKNQTLELEIGFGRGIFIENRAKTNPDINLIGIELRKSITDEVKKRINNKYENLYLLHGNGVTFLNEALPDNCLSRVFLFHPDPWFKKKHHKRRIVGPLFLDSIKKKLKSNGMISFATDVESLWLDQKDKLLNENFREVDDHKFWKEDFRSHWSVFSKKEKRQHFFSSFKI